MVNLLTSFVLFFLVFIAISTTLIEAQATKQCEYEMIVNTGVTRGPSYKLDVELEAIGGANINTSNVVKNWGAMGRGYTYFLPNSSDKFRTKLPCMVANFCWIGIKGKKGELNTKGDGGISRMKTFRFGSGNEVDIIYPYVSDGECP
ncbi:hypothetical protein MKW94_020075 [Papaver nudicaule]|uniref:Uncharacterized protein n=1 Tax=Papaver nudicaule TaxID=74823 RepID=A0AA41VUR0_PAPNU|nr:hypothetical protein [Papaver nudicaule]